jgi:hypothetical protein
MSIANAITQFIEQELSKTKNTLLELGVSEEIIDKAFNSTENGEEKIAPMPTRRMLGNTCVTTTTLRGSQEDKHTNSTKANCTPQNAAENLVQKWVGKSDVVLVLNYTDKTHALFGDFAKTHLGFKNDFLKQTSWMKYNQTLAFGPGWIVIDKIKVAELRKALKSKNIAFREVEKDEFVKELSKTKTVAEISESLEEEVKKSKKEVETKSKIPEPTISKSKNVKEPDVRKEKPEVKKTETKVEVKRTETKVEMKKAEPVASKITKNQWGNFVQESSGLVFKKLPIGEKGKLVLCIIGYQDSDPEEDETGIDTVLPLTPDHLEEAVKNHSKYPTMTEETIKKVRNVDKDLADQLQDIQTRNLEDIDEDDLSDIDEDDLSDIDEDDLEDDDDEDL